MFKIWLVRQTTKGLHFYAKGVIGMLFPAAFVTNFKTTLGDMSPQNRRAFKALIKLLAE